MQNASSTNNVSTTSTSETAAKTVITVRSDLPVVVGGDVAVGDPPPSVIKHGSLPLLQLAFIWLLQHASLPP